MHDFTEEEALFNVGSGQSLALFVPVWLSASNMAHSLLSLISLLESTSWYPTFAYSKGFATHYLVHSLPQVSLSAQIPSTPSKISN